MRSSVKEETSRDILVNSRHATVSVTTENTPSYLVVKRTAGWIVVVCPDGYTIMGDQVHLRNNCLFLTKGGQVVLRTNIINLITVLESANKA